MEPYLWLGEQWTIHVLGDMYTGYNNDCQLDKLN